jgi:hypothetical protein
MAGFAVRGLRCADSTTGYRPDSRRSHLHIVGSCGDPKSASTACLLPSKILVVAPKNPGCPVHSLRMDGSFPQRRRSRRTILTVARAIRPVGSVCRIEEDRRRSPRIFARRRRPADRSRGQARDRCASSKDRQQLACHP